MTASALLPAVIRAKVTIEWEVRQGRPSLRVTDVCITVEERPFKGRVSAFEKSTGALALRAARQQSTEETMSNRNSQTLGSQTMTEFCEQLNPCILLTLRDHKHDEARRPTRDMFRVQESWVAAAENAPCSGWPRAPCIASAPTT